MGETGGKHVISAMQGDSMITYIQYSKICLQRVTSQYDGISDWQNKPLLCKNDIINY